MLENIYGVGTKTSLLWYKQGVRTLDDARKRADLSYVQRIGIDHYEDFSKKMARSETQRHFERVQQAVKEMDPEAECICMGSYRRGNPECGDIDIILTKRNVDLKHLRNLLLGLVVKLFKEDFLKCALAGPDPREYGYDIQRMQSEFVEHFHNIDGISKWYGASLLEDVGIWRRIDFLIVPQQELGAALLYFTGNALFNRSIRLLANQKGYTLNQHGLFKNAIRLNRFKTTGGQLIEAQDERKIFEILGVPYREPNERSIM